MEKDTQIDEELEVVNDTELDKVTGGSELRDEDPLEGGRCSEHGDMLVRDGSRFFCPTCRHSGQGPNM